MEKLEKMASNEQSTAGTKKVLTRKQKILKEIYSLAILVICVFAFRSTFFEPFKIPSGSMIPTLMIGDFILVNKFSYGFKIPFSDMYSDPIYITKSKFPKRGDVVVFKFPQDPDVNYIKRVIGLPGDKIRVRDKVVHVNGTPLEMNDVSGKKIMADMDDKFKHISFGFFESVIGEHKHTVLTNKGTPYNANFPEVTVPKGHFFVMGDNRDFSYDSRNWGFVPHRHLKGKALFVWFSMSLPFDGNVFKFRPHRIGTPIN